MEREAQSNLDGIRAARSDVENGVIDDLLGGRITRRQFIRWGTVAGMSMPVLGAIIEACGPIAGTSNGPLKLLLLASDTGPAASYGPVYRAGWNAAIADINSNGGVLGRQLKATIRDDGTDTSRAVTVVQDEITNNKPDYVHNGAISSNGPGVTPLLTRAKIISVQAAQNEVMNDTLKFPYYFSNGLKASTYSIATAGYLKGLGVKTVGILAPTDGTGTTLILYAPQAFKDAGINVLDIERYVNTDLDMSSQLRKLDAKNPDYLLLSMGLSAPAGYILQNIDRLGIQRPLIGDIGTSGGLNENATSFPGAKSLSRLKLVAFAVQARGEGARGSNAAVTAEIPVFKNYENGKISNIQISTLAYDSISIWATAAAQAKSADADKVKAVLESWEATPSSKTFLTFDKVAFSSTNHFTNSGVSGIAIVQAGTLDSNSTRQIVSTLT
jgi:branched-chain amino acid transport system substrate-binding protein